MRCHSQAFTIKLRQDLPLDEIEARIAGHNDWVHLVSNQKEVTMQELTPAKVSDTLEVPVGRLRKMTIGMLAGPTSSTTSKPFRPGI